MDYKEALEYINGVSWLGSKPGLERVRELLEKLGRPQDGLKFIHIAGTNGKGSCAALLSSVMKCCGYKTGLFTSPYLFRFNERMQINGKQIEDEALADIVERIKPQAEAMEQHPTEFEMMTAAALLWVKEQNCDGAVLETGGQAARHQCNRSPGGLRDNEHRPGPYGDTGRYLGKDCG